ncbi:MAG: peptide chain release factor N(5)-glutamine methyltransferase [Bacilli bacterium]|nr:peptide chain release factor N(5)-glutamine methyltransferase [Bacilli bacterium]
MTLYHHFDDECSNYNQLLECFERIKNGEPFQYVIEKAHFIDLVFYVNKYVLIPRQETEELVIGTKVMIDKMLPLKTLTIADVCTGSGVIGLYMKKLYPSAEVYLSDIDEKCLAVAKKNGEMHHLSVKYLQGDLLQPIIEKGIKLDVLVCNPPYIGSKETIDEQVWKYEPHKALLAEPKTKYYEEIFKVADQVMKPDSILAFEIGEDMEDEICALVEYYFPNSAYKLAKDMYGKLRFLYIMIKEDGNYA